MWRIDEVGFELAPEHCEGNVDTIRVSTPAGELLIMGVFTDMPARVLRVTGAHTNGAPGGLIVGNSLGVANLMVIAQAFMEAFDYGGLIVEGADRTSGRRSGKRPRPLRFTRHRQN
jgi:hypothetical protein